MAIYESWLFQWRTIYSCDDCAFDASFGTVTLDHVSLVLEPTSLAVRLYLIAKRLLDRSHLVQQVQ